MGAVVALETLFNAGRVWKGRPTAPAASPQPTGHAMLDAALPGGGWPEAALTEILIAAQGVGELQLLWPTLARLSAAGERIVLVAPPHVPYPQAWQSAGVDLRQLAVIQAGERDALWAAEQCLRSGSCGAVLCWPQQADDRALRRLQVAAETGQTLAFAYRSLKEAINPSPAALRLAVEARPAQLRVLKCRGGLAHSAPIAFAPGP
ncbi:MULTISPECIES: translesion DNA synthesis-associated protein ImuA [Pseudomonas]|uniref:Translesion DNA synthesis-associated protein ImuA n=1 Tax=Pseudomonas chlororaphis TaxID=587753 RepID=A0AB34C579_9PSED|nr:MULTISPECIES: translesion DNA synthesis-associated protein ImuA [Pseudomonas]KAA5840361.1 translesion DNA synthesis-associated protein ImuA [Pseudomonas chlororaphis]PMY39168.1 translesion DNA synthesis-associated protein ImuA [Pseudomonas sp. GW456-L14]PMY57859.1 translesion DNA synthesis-associated protein ImuA [Pseudomonas sp. GW456-L12]WDG52680.1 translesion DNA synthesis-associated protein ImuA [Pseudomonas chlororaphis]WDH51133.1 translesion DNA synthesis-associated protein ImuA [Pseu